MAGVVAKKLNELNQNTKNAIVTALVITKTDPKYFLVKRTMEFRGIVTYTLRDSKNSICNCKYWGSKESVVEYNNKIKIGDIINVVCPMVVLYKFCSENQHFLPFSTLPIMLVVNEGSGSLTLNDYHNVEMFGHLQELKFIPHRPLYDALRLCDVRYSYANIVECASSSSDSKRSKGKMPTQQVDLVVMIALLRPVKEIQRGDDDEISHCLEVIVFDQSIPDGMLFSIWQLDWIQRASACWQPMKTILHLIDVDIVDSNYHKSCILRKSSRTIIYENPLGKEADALRKYATEMEPRNFHRIGQILCGEAVPNPEDIQTQMTVQQIYMHLEGHIKDDEDEFTAVLYAMMTQFNVDGPYKIVGRKCTLCQRILAASDTICSSYKCQLALSLNHNGDYLDYFYNININFGDHTGTLIEARLNETIAEAILETPASNFEEGYRGKDHILEDLKWRYLFKHFELKLVVRKSTSVRRRPLILIVSMRSADDLQFIASKIMVG